MDWFTNWLIDWTIDQLRYGRDMEDTWRRYGRDMEEIRKRYGGDIEDMWRRFGKDMEEIWREIIDCWWLFSSGTVCSGVHPDEDSGSLLDGSPGWRTASAPSHSQQRKSSHPRSTFRLTETPWAPGQCILFPSRRHSDYVLSGGCGMRRRKKKRWKRRRWRDYMMEEGRRM